MNQYVEHPFVQKWKVCLTFSYSLRAQVEIVTTETQLILPVTVLELKTTRNLEA